MQACKLDGSESKPNITLKKIGHELDIAETKCFTLKSELNYMMGVYQKAQTGVKGSKGASNILAEQNVVLQDKPSLKSLAEFTNRNSDIIVMNETLNYKIPEKYDSVERISEKNFEVPCFGSKSIPLSSGGSSYHDIIEKYENTNVGEENQRKLLSVTITPRSQLDRKFPPAITTIPVQSKTLTADASDKYKNRWSPHSEHISEYLQSMMDVKESVEKLTSKKDEDYFQKNVPNLVRKNLEDPQMNLDISYDIKTRRTEKYKHTPRTEKGDTNQIGKTKSIISKTRKRKGKLRSSISKSTVTTKDTNFIRKKEIKKRRQKDRNVSRQQFNFTQHSKKFANIMELTALENNNSGASNKHCKLDQQEKYVKKQHIPGTDQREKQEKLFSEQAKCQHKSQSNENQPNHCLQTLSCLNDSKGIPENVQPTKSIKYSNGSYSPILCKTHQCERIVCNDPVFTHGYEMPTLASKLKRSNKSFFSRFNFQNIPFVVGTSVAPSHNLGLNIQQVLSVMKTRLPITDGITPVLIRKVSRGVTSVSTLLERMNEQYEKSILDVNSRMIGTRNNKESAYICEDKNSSLLHLHEAEAQNTCTSNFSDSTSQKDGNTSKQSCKEKNDFGQNQKIKQQSLSVIHKGDTLENITNQQKISRMFLTKEDNNGDEKLCVVASHSTNDIRQVLIKFHDQLEEMIVKQEKLQIEVEKSNDKSLAQELSTLEKELNNKEKEINTVINLYREVKMLKQQMKMLHKKNSFVCITTKSPMDSFNDSHLTSVIPGKSRSMNLTQIFDRKKRNVYSTARELPNSIQLAVLLRQIQSYHKQLRLTS